MWQSRVNMSRCDWPRLTILERGCWVTNITPSPHIPKNSSSSYLLTLDPVNFLLKFFVVYFFSEIKMAIAAFEEFSLELVYHQSSLVGIQIVTTDESLFSHLHYLFERSRKLLIDIHLRLAQLKKERAMVSTQVASPSSFVGYTVGGGNALTFADTYRCRGSSLCRSPTCCAS